MGFAPFLPSKKSIVKKSLELANLKPNQYLFDLGCGTGRVLVLGAKEYKARVVGFEISPLLFLIAKINLFLHRVNGEIFLKNFLEANLEKADVVFLFLNPPILKKLEPKLKRGLKPGTKIVAVSSPLPTLKPVKILPLSEFKNKVNVYLYIL